MAISTDTFYQDLEDLMEVNAVSKDFILKKNVPSVKQSIRSLLKYHYYDKIWDPQCGSYFPNLLFSQNDPVWLGIAKESIVTILSRYEPRIRVLEVTLESTQEGAITITVNYEVIVTGNRDSYSFTVNRLR